MKGLGYRRGGPDDVALLSRLNRELCEDEGHRLRTMPPAEFERRMRTFMEQGYRAVIFSREGRVAGYALYIEREDLVYLRQFFVDRGCRRSGVGRAMMRTLMEEIWPRDRRLTVDVLATNRGGYAFWKALGYRDYALELEIRPEDC